MYRIQITDYSDEASRARLKAKKVERLLSTNALRLLKKRYFCLQQHQRQHTLKKFGRLNYAAKVPMTVRFNSRKIITLDNLPKINKTHEQYYKLLNDFNIKYTQDELSTYLKLFFSQRNELLKGNCYIVKLFLRSKVSCEQLKKYQTEHRQLLALFKYSLTKPTGSFSGYKKRTFLVFESLGWISGLPCYPVVPNSAPKVFHEMLKIIQLEKVIYSSPINSSSTDPYCSYHTQVERHHTMKLA